MKCIFKSNGVFSFSFSFLYHRRKILDLCFMPSYDSELRRLDTAREFGQRDYFADLAFIENLYINTNIHREDRAKLLRDAVRFPIFDQGIHGSGGIEDIEKFLNQLNFSSKTAFISSLSRAFGKRVSERLYQKFLSDFKRSLNRYLENYQPDSFFTVRESDQVEKMQQYTEEELRKEVVNIVQFIEEKNMQYEDFDLVLHDALFFTCASTKKSYESSPNKKAMEIVGFLNKKYGKEKVRLYKENIKRVCAPDYHGTDEVERRLYELFAPLNNLDSRDVKSVIQQSAMYFQDAGLPRWKFSEESSVRSFVSSVKQMLEYQIKKEKHEELFQKLGLFFETESQKVEEKQRIERMYKVDSKKMVPKEYQYELWDLGKKRREIFPLFFEFDVEKSITIISQATRDAGVQKEWPRKFDEPVLQQIMIYLNEMHGKEVVDRFVSSVKQQCEGLK
ncbi:TPA: hypothetical protein DD617_04275 [Candidatus Uhrbacteria bacterium]|nr:hypothetical protein [Candidatus Uhrbacteria bacterium]